LLEEARILAPDDPQVAYNLGVAYQTCGRDALAALRYADTLRLHPDFHDARWNLSEILRLGEHFAEAIEHLEYLDRAGARYPALLHRLAVAYGGLQRHRDAVRTFVRELRAPANRDLAMWELSHVLLATGRYKAGWRAYNHRFAVSDLINVHCEPYPLPRWQGEPLAGKRLLIHGEQGLGDEIMFAGVVPELLAEAEEVIVGCQPPLVDLFARSFPRAKVFAHQPRYRPLPLDGLPPIDYQIPIGSLMAYRRNTPADFSRTPHPYLQADPQRAEYFRQQLLRRAPSSTQGLRVGLAWGSNPASWDPKASRRAHQKSIPARALEPLSGLDRVQFVSLQNRTVAGEAAHAPALELIDFSHDLLTLADTAALMRSLDLVITVDTSLAHLAGGLGVPAWVLLMQHCDWRWLREGDGTPWYPSVTLLRQHTQGDWTPVLHTVRDKLAAMTGAHA
jgi:tetratricopeptide (TPR) repeat protein